MKFGDYSPAAFPSLEQQRDALRKGLGRAFQWAATGRLNSGVLLDACLHDEHSGMHIEYPRGDWLWKIVQAAGATERFRVPILHALYEMSDEDTTAQLCELARCYAETGDDAFRLQLYAIVERKPFPEAPWIGEEEIVALDGVKGFLFAVRLRGQSLASREWEWDDNSFIRDAVETLGEEQVNALLEAATEPDTRRFRDQWLAETQRKAERKSYPSYRERMTAITIEEIIEAAQLEAPELSFRGWGKYAAEADLKIVLDMLFAERQPSVIKHLVHVFSARALPEFDSRLIELCRHSDEDVRRLAYAALAVNSHPLVREFAIAELETGLRDTSAMELFVKNYKTGDEDRILDALQLPDDEIERHRLLIDVRNVLEENLEADCSRLGVIAYAETPCELCRSAATKLLVDDSTAPEWLTEEIRFDSSEDCREFVDKSASPPNET